MFEVEIIPPKTPSLAKLGRISSLKRPANLLHSLNFMKAVSYQQPVCPVLCFQIFISHISPYLLRIWGGSPVVGVTSPQWLMSHANRVSGASSPPFLGCPDTNQVMELRCIPSRDSCPGGGEIMVVTRGTQGWTFLGNFLPSKLTCTNPQFLKW